MIVARKYEISVSTFSFLHLGDGYFTTGKT